MRGARIVVVTLLVALAAGVAEAQAPVAYRLSFPEPQHHWMQVDLTLTEVPAGVLELHMSRSSPGRYSLHEFAKNVFAVEVTDPAGTTLAFDRPNPHQWHVGLHGPSVHVRYRVFGDRIDGTYLSVDATHAHINMPSALMWARGFEERAASVRFDLPAGAGWRVATQLFSSGEPFTFTAPNLQYLMDSPSELSAFALRAFSVPDGLRRPTFRIAAHHEGADRELNALTRDVETIVREARRVFGEFAPFDNGTYTFIADYLPWANGDGMEHRNSAIVTSATSLQTNREGILGTISHEFFHSWNIERIRPKSLEPFNFDEVNMSGELWLAEGFTNYYGPLVLRRAGLTSMDDFTAEMGGMIDTVIGSPARRVHTLEEMSRLAPFKDAAVSIDPTGFDNTFISYYTWGGALAIGLDLTLRDRSDGAVTLDHLMRALWQRHGTSSRRAGYVDHPYTMADVKSALAAVSGDAAFADAFFARFIQGHDVVDYGLLLARAGLVLRPAHPGRVSAGPLDLQETRGRVRVAAPTLFESPAYAAGIDRDDAIVSVGGTPIQRVADFQAAIGGRRAGDEVPIVFERRGQRVAGTLRLIEDRRQEVVTAEAAGQPLTEAQKRFRAAWLSGGG